MPIFDLVVDYDVIQKRYLGIFEIFIFLDFTGRQSSKFCYFRHFGPNFQLWRPVKSPKMKISKIPKYLFCITSYGYFMAL